MKRRILNMQRCFALIVSLGLMIALAACGDDGEGTAAADRGVKIEPTDTVLPDSGNPSGNAGTLFFQVRSTITMNDAENLRCLDIHAPGQALDAFEVIQNAQFVRFIFTTESGAEHDLSVPVSTLATGSCHTIAVTWD